MCGRCREDRGVPTITPSATAKAKAAGVYKGRPASIDAEQVRKMKADSIRPTDIAIALKIGRASVYRLLAVRD